MFWWAVLLSVWTIFCLGVAAWQWSRDFFDAFRVCVFEDSIVEKNYCGKITRIKWDDVRLVQLLTLPNGEEKSEQCLFIEANLLEKPLQISGDTPGFDNLVGKLREKLDGFDNTPFEEKATEDELFECWSAEEEGESIVYGFAKHA